MKTILILATNLELETLKEHMEESGEKPDQIILTEEAALDQDIINQVQAAFPDVDVIVNRVRIWSPFSPIYQNHE